MDDNNTRCNQSEGIVAISLEEYSQMVRASERLEIVKLLYKNLSSIYDLDKAINAILFENKEADNE